MMGRNHVKHGIMVCAVIGSSGVISILTKDLVVPPSVIIIAASMITTGSVLPDIDSASSATKSYGLLTKILSWLVQGVSWTVFMITKAPRETGRGRHRYLTHTFIGNLIMGICLAFVCSIDTSRGPIPAIVTLGLLAGIGVHAFGGKVRHWKWHIVIAISLAVYLTPEVTGLWPWVWGAALTVGCAVHCFGDGCTETGIPYWWHPFRHGQKRWVRQWVLPDELRFHTGKVGETIMIWLSGTVTVAICLIFIFVL